MIAGLILFCLQQRRFSALQIFLIALLSLAALVPAIFGQNSQTTVCPFKVFILAGPSIMKGGGAVEIPDSSHNDGQETLRYPVKNSSTADQFKHPIDRMASGSFAMFGLGTSAMSNMYLKTSTTNSPRAMGKAMLELNTR